MTQRFRSGVDGWLAVVAVGLPIALGLVFRAGGLVYGVPSWWTTLPLVLLVAVVVWLLASTSYAFEGAALQVRSGPFRWRIPLEQIYAVRESDSVRSAPAMSMDRLEIRFADDDRLVISPKDKPGFLSELHRQVPRLANHSPSPRPAI